MNTPQYVPLGGGINLVTSPRMLKPGSCLFAINYECPVTGGYRRIDGYTKLGATLPGTGPVLGVVFFNEDYYAIRQNGADATLYRLDGGTWTSVGTVSVGRYEFDEGNFTATAPGRALYMVGEGKPYELKGGVLTEITEAAAGAKYIAVHNNYLWLGFSQGSVQYSEVGDPLGWDGAAGAGEIGTQQKLTGLLPGTGGVLHVACRDSMQAIYGSSPQNFERRITVPNSSVKAYSLQSMLQPYFVAERGISNLEATQQFGDFRQLQAGASTEPLFTKDGWASRIQCSGLSKSRAQYRVFIDDGSGVYLSPTGTTTVKFPDKPQVMHSGEKASGEEVTIFGDDAGNVYRLGNEAESFNGEPITAFLTLAYNDLRSPTVRKRFRRVIWDIRSGSTASVTFKPDFDYGGSASAEALRQRLNFLLSGGLWDVAKWDDFVWSSPIMGEEPADATGTGNSINFAIHSNTVSAPHEMLGYQLIYSQRRLRRA